jgi:hypothetical protein
MNNTKTTIAGVGLLLTGLGAGIKFFLAGDIPNAVTAIVGGISGFYLGLKAADAPKADAPKVEEKK